MSKQCEYKIERNDKLEAWAIFSRGKSESEWHQSSAWFGDNYKGYLERRLARLKSKETK